MCLRQFAEHQFPTQRGTLRRFAWLLQVGLQLLIGARCGTIKPPHHCDGPLRVGPVQRELWNLSVAGHRADLPTAGRRRPRAAPLGGSELAPGRALGVLLPCHRDGVGLQSARCARNIFRCQPGLLRARVSVGVWRGGDLCGPAGRATFTMAQLELTVALLAVCHPAGWLAASRFVAPDSLPPPAGQRYRPLRPGAPLRVRGLRRGSRQPPARGGHRGGGAGTHATNPGGAGRHCSTRHCYRPAHHARLVDWIRA